MLRIFLFLALSLPIDEGRRVGGWVNDRWVPLCVDVTTPRPHNRFLARVYNQTDFRGKYCDLRTYHCDDLCDGYTVRSIYVSECTYMYFGKNCTGRKVVTFAGRNQRNADIHRYPNLRGIKSFRACSILAGGSNENPGSVINSEDIDVENHLDVVFNNESVKINETPIPCAGPNNWFYPTTPSKRPIPTTTPMDDDSTTTTEEPNLEADEN